jgi:uncharacterized protein YdaT
MVDKKVPDEMFVTRREDKRYNVLQPDAIRPSAVTDTQREGIDRAKEIKPGAAVHIQRVRGNPPGPDKFRKE